MQENFFSQILCRVVLGGLSWLEEGPTFHCLSVQMFESLDRRHHTARLTSHTLLQMLLSPGTLLRALITLTFPTFITTSEVVTIIIPTRGR